MWIPSRRPTRPKVPSRTNTSRLAWRWSSIVAADYPCLPAFTRKIRARADARPPRAGRSSLWRRGRLAQLARALALQARGPRFKSETAHRRRAAGAASAAAPDVGLPTRPRLPERRPGDADCVTVSTLPGRLATVEDSRPNITGGQRDVEMLRRYARTRDPRLREQLVHRYLPLARYAASQYRRGRQPFA